MNIYIYIWQFGQIEAFKIITIIIISHGDGKHEQQTCNHIL